MEEIHFTYVLRKINILDFKLSPCSEYSVCVFFWVIPRRLIYKCRRFETLYLFHLYRQVWSEARVQEV